MKKITVPILCLCIFTGLLCAFGTPAAGKEAAEETASENSNNIGDAGIKMVLHEPEYLKPSDINHKPVFTLSWDPYPNAYSYEFAIYVEGEDSYGRGPFAIRSTKDIYSKEAASADLYFLQGIYTDTATYRIKIRPILKAEKKEDYIWSNIWQISFVDGEYTVTSTEADFDEEIAAADVQKEEKKDGGGNTDQPAKEAKEPLDHSFPEELLLFLAREKGETEAISAEDIASFSVCVTYSEDDEPNQNFTDDETVEAFKKAVKQMTVTGRDGQPNLKTYYEYSAKDAEGNTLFSFGIQDGFLTRGYERRYNIEGLSELLSIPGIWLEKDWSKFWREDEERADAYERDLDPVGMDLLEAAGYETHLMNSGAPDNIVWIVADIFNDGDILKDTPIMQTREKQEIESIYAALLGIKVGKHRDDIGGSNWRMQFGYGNPACNFSRVTRLYFKGDCVILGGGYYELDNIKELYGSLDCEIFSYLKDFSEAPALKPVY